MNLKQMDIFTKHCDTYFNGSDCLVLHCPDGLKPHIDVLLYKPSEDYPFWKLVTMGASDIKMPPSKNTLGRRNEYMLFVDPSEDLTVIENAAWYANKLTRVALYPLTTRTPITYGHSIEWGEEDGSDMVGAYLELPQVFPDTSILRCKLGLFKTAVCLQVVLITRDDVNKLLEIGSEQFSEFLYPEEGEGHFISERIRSEKF